MDILSTNKLEKYIKDHKFSIKSDTINFIVNSFNKKTSKLYKNLNSKKGGAFLPGEFFGINTGAYNHTLSTPPTEMSTPNALNTSTRPELVSNTFPLQNGGCGCGMVGGGSCGTCYKQQAGCAGMCGAPQSGGKLCNKHNSVYCSCNHKGGCIVCKNFFSQKNIKNIASLLNIKVNKNNYQQINQYLSNDLKKIMHLTFNQVKNKDKLIGKSHFLKAVKQF